MPSMSALATSCSASLPRSASSRGMTAPDAHELRHVADGSKCGGLFDRGVHAELVGEHCQELHRTDGVEPEIVPEVVSLANLRRLDAREVGDDDHDALFDRHEA